MAFEFRHIRYLNPTSKSRVEWSGVEPMAMASTLQGVFVDTNLGTRLAIDVSRDITARDFKSKS